MVDDLAPEDAELLETLSPELARLLYPDRIDGPFTVTAVYPQLEGEIGESARALASGAISHTVAEPAGEARTRRHRTTFSLAQIEEFHELYHLLQSAVGADRLTILLNDREVPLARELWLPLLWTLRK
jgi:hypothetical protein